MQLEQVIIIIHVVIALAIIGLILLQQGKGADMGASFGSGSSQTVFGGAGGGNVLTQATAVLAALFFATSLALAVVAKNYAGSAGMLDLDVPGSIEVMGSIDDAEVPEVEADTAEGELPARGAEGVDSELPGIDE